MTYPVSIDVTFDFSNGPVFGYSFTLDDPQHGILGTNVLADTVSDVVDISSQVGKISIKRGYNLLQDQFQSGTATIRVYDPTGAWSPQNPASPYYGKLIPLRKMRVAGNGTYLFSGYTISYNYTYPKDQDIGFVDIECVDAFRLLSMANITTVPVALLDKQQVQELERYWMRYLGQLPCVILTQVNLQFWQTRAQQGLP